MSYPHTFRTEHTETVTTSSAYGAFYRRQKRPHVSLDKTIVPLLDYVDENTDRFVKDLKEFVEIPNIAGSFENRHDMTKAIRLVEKWLNLLEIKYECFDVGWYEMSTACCKMPNVIMGQNTIGHSRKKKTLLIYAHLDIKPPDMEQWKTDPYDVVKADKKFYGAGTSYGKGPLLCWFHALQAYKDYNLEMPINIKFIIESMHEQKHAGLETLLNSKKSKFLSDVDYVVVHETEWLGPKMPCIAYGAVGLCRFEVTVKKHSDSDPQKDIDMIFDNICDKDNNILIPDFAQHVIQISPDEELLYDQIDYKFDEIRKTLPPHRKNWDKLQLLMKFWRLPDIYLGPVEECNCEKNDKSILKRKFTMKIVPLQVPEKIGEMVVKHVFKVCNDLQCQSVVDCEMINGTRPWMEDFSSANYEAARRATIQVYKEDPNLIREDKEIPIILLLQRVLQKNILLLPLTAGDGDSGRSNENIHKKQLFEGTKLLICYLFQLGSM